MNIGKIQLINNTADKGQNRLAVKSRPAGYYSAEYTPNHAVLSKDIFEYAKPSDKIAFQGGFCFIGNEFAQKFPKTFFNKIVESGIHCAYTGIKLISQKDYSALQMTGVLNKRGVIAVKYLKKFEESMFPIEHSVFNMLEKLSKKNPNLKLQELLQLKYPEAEKILSAQQQPIIDKMMIIAQKNLPEEEAKQELLPLLQKSLYKILDSNIAPSDRFRKKEFMVELLNTKISDDAVKDKLIKLAEQLPSSSNSVNAFIVKYSQPIKIKYVNGENIVTPRTSEELGLRLIKPSLRTDEHIYPQKLFRLEEQARQNGNQQAEQLSKLRVTVLTSERINGEKNDTLIDDFIKDGRCDIPKNIQSHLDELVYKCEVWLKQGKIDDAVKLSDYITELEKEFKLRSNLVKPEIKDFWKLTKKIEIAQERRNIKLASKKDKPGNLSEQYYNEVFKNRKDHRFACRYV